MMDYLSSGGFMSEMSETKYGKLYSRNSKRLIIYLHGLTANPFNNTGMSILNFVKWSETAYDFLGFELHTGRGFLTTTVEKQAKRLNQAISEFKQQGYDNIYIIASSYGSLVALTANNSKIDKQCCLLPSLVVNSFWQAVERNEGIYDGYGYLVSFDHSNLSIMYSHRLLSEGLSFTKHKAQCLLNNLKVNTFFCHGKEDVYYKELGNLSFDNSKCQSRVLEGYSHEIVDRDDLDNLVRYAFDYIRK